MQPRSAQVLQAGLHRSAGAKERRHQDDKSFHNLACIASGGPSTSKARCGVPAFLCLSRSAICCRYLVRELPLPALWRPVLWERVPSR